MDGLDLSAYPSWIQAAIGIGFMAAAFFAAVNGRHSARHRDEDASMRVVGGALADRGSMVMLAEALREHTRAVRAHAEAVDRARISVNDGVDRIMRIVNMEKRN